MIAAHPTSGNVMKPEIQRLRGKRVAILAGDGFEYVELVVPKKALERAGALTEVVSVHEGKIRGMNISEPGRAVKVDCTLEKADPSRYDALVIPGGFIGPDFIRQSQKARRFVRAFDDEKKPIATLCHGPWLLVSAELVGGRTLSSWPGIRDDIVHAGGIWRDEPVVIDDNWVSSRGPADLNRFVPAMLYLFGRGARAEGAAHEEVEIAEETYHDETGHLYLQRAKFSSPKHDEPPPLIGALTKHVSRPALWTLFGLAVMLGIGALALRRLPRLGRALRL
jgi:protease I